ncbi:MAG: fumarylacetoacetate hydrolase family protein [Candidatus Eremiobacteraeota bacterium]|nr:fumarylacetoacetate hydrolase family protein [Candidatus Eremiobacteraeota bacterium]
MRLCTFLRDGVARIGAERGGTVVDLRAVDARIPATMRELLGGGEAALEQARTAEQRAGGEHRVARADVTLLPPVPDPQKIACIGLNYRDHAAEVNLELPTHVTVFAKWNNVLVGDGAPILIPRASHRVDYEAELAFVVGRRARNVAEADAYDHIAGYTCFNDVSVRDYQALTSQWTLGKTFDTHGPCGPVLVTRDEIPNPHRLAIRTTIGGEVLQDSTTANLIFTVPRLLAELSAVMTLEPGDIVATGTPPGVGMARTPRRWILPGERVRIEIEAIGALENPAAAEPGAP